MSMLWRRWFAEILKLLGQVLQTHMIPCYACLAMKYTATALGVALKERRLALGLSWPKLAWKISQATGEHLDQSYIARIEEGGIQRPEKERLRLIAEIVGLSPDEAFRLADYHTEQDGWQSASSPCSGARPDGHSFFRTTLTR